MFDELTVVAGILCIAAGVMADGTKSLCAPAMEGWWMSGD